MTVRVSFVAASGREEDAAWAWLEAQQSFAARRFRPLDLIAAASEADVVWVHSTVEPVAVGLERLRPRLESGLGIVLTLRAASLVGPLGIESEMPNDVRQGRWAAVEDEYRTAEFAAMPDYPHVRGLATWGPHPLVDGLHLGTYCWAPTEGEPWVRCVYEGTRPAEAQVVAVERAYLAQNPARTIAWEYEVGRGRVMCIGAYVHFAAPDRLLRPQLERLVTNAIYSVTLESAELERAAWPVPAGQPVATEALLLPDPLDLEGALPDPESDPLALDGTAEGDEQFDLAGRRLLLVGRERSGIREVWVHPNRAVSGWTVTADDEVALGRRIVVGREAVTRHLETGRRHLVETSFVALEHPFALVEYHAARKGRESVGRAPATFELILTVDLRRMWPYGPGCAGTLRFRRGADGMVALIEADSGEGVVALFTNRPVELSLRAVTVADRDAVECDVQAPLGVPLRLAVVGAANRDDLDRVLRSVRRLGVAGLVRQRSQRTETMSQARVSVVADDADLQRAVEWAKHRLDSFVADVPGVGRSLVAGYSTSRPGWNEARPGYAWFLCRDAVWTSLAMLAAGEFSIPRQVLRFLGDRQDVTGKVLHEATTSGQIHYDAADSTPLYLLLAARYLAWTNDRDFIRSIWPRLERALAWCMTTDTDGDGLIENTRVGHGWIEGGPLAGAHVSLYLAAVWGAALEGMARAAQLLGHPRIAADCFAAAARAVAAIEAGFYDERRGFYALDRRRDGRYEWVITALHAVPILLGVVRPTRCAKVLDELGGPLSAPWGVRMLPPSHPLFSPTGYHCGSVWPLFTGWASLAEYRTGRFAQGFRHLKANARLPFARQLGAFDEVLHGLEERGAGVCPDQAWSAAMLIAPLVSGLFGVEPDAPAGALTIAPALPGEWDWMELRSLRCGETVCDIRVRRRGKTHRISVRRTLGPPLWATVSPVLGEPVQRVEVDDTEVVPQLRATAAGTAAAVSFQVAGEHEVSFHRE
ncbi:MAG TPA: GH116 family glycosyl hydrolase [Gemmatimonadales bacterium]|nr:GH116 family glycosyl hydrolase [Gemmatimonadales bacterium]